MRVASLRSVLVTSIAAASLAVFLTGLSEFASADYRSAVTALSPTHYWHLDESTGGSGTTAVNATGGQAGTYLGLIDEGVAFLGAEGPQVNIAPGNLAFDVNNNAAVDIGPGAAMANTTMTVAAWFREAGSEGGDRLWTNNLNDPNTSFQIFFGGGSGDVAANIGIGLNPAVNGFPAEGLPSGSGVGNFHIKDSIVRVKDGQWHHIVASRNGNNIENVIVVIDGVNYGPDQWSDSTDTWGTDAANALIANRTPPDGGPSRRALNGAVDEVAVWLGRQLTVAEAIGLYNAATGQTAPGDFNGDGDVDGADFMLGQRDSFNTLSLSDFKTNFGPGAVSAVPEPSAIWIALASVAVLGGSRRLRRSAKRQA